LFGSKVSTDDPKVPNSDWGLDTVGPTVAVASAVGEVSGEVCLGVGETVAAADGSGTIAMGAVVAFF
jgi:hypothetical protein